MKKVIFLFLLLFAISVQASEKTYINYNYINNFYYNGIVDGKKVSYNAMYMEHNGQTLYCLGFSIPISRVNGYTVYKFSDVNNYTEEQKKYIEAIAYFGYGYKGDTNINYYFAAQELIWEALGSEMYWTKSLNGTDIIDLSGYKRNILTFYNKYINEPDYIVEDNTVEIGNYYVFQDVSMILGQYNVSYSGNNLVESTSEGIYVEPKVKGEDVIYLEKDFYKPFESELFLEPGYQPVLKAGDISNKIRIINLDVRNTSILFKRKNRDVDNTNPVLRLDGAIYEVYDSNNNLVSTFETDENGDAVVEGLSIGQYTIKEIIPSYGFEKDETIYDISLNFGYLPAKKEVYVNPIKKELSITNIYKIDGIEYKDSGIIFEIYKDNILCDTLNTDDNGMTSIYLEYGEYLVKQINAREDFEVEPEFMVIVNDSNNLNFIFIKEKINEVEQTDVEEQADEVEQANMEEQTNETEQVSEENVISEEEQIKEEVIETDIPLDYEDTLDIDMEELPQLGSNKDFVDVLCENLFLLFLL